MTTAIYAEDIQRVPVRPDDLAAVELIDDVYVMHGLAGMPSPDNRGLIANLGFVVTGSGVVVIDSGATTEHAQRLLAAIAKRTDEPVTHVLNTHVHGDHWLGNAAILDTFTEAKVYAHPNMVDLAGGQLGEDWLALFNRLTDGAAEGTEIVAPTQTLSGGDQFEVGDVTFSVYHAGDAHTTSDIMILVQTTDGTAFFLGDNAFHQRIGRMDDGNFEGNIAALQTAVSQDATVYIPGHGPSTLGVGAARSYLDYLLTLHHEVSTLFDEGLSDFEMKDQVVAKLSPWSDWSGFGDEVGRHISFCYLQVEEAAF